MPLLGAVVRALESQSVTSHSYRRPLSFTTDRGFGGARSLLISAALVVIRVVNGARGRGIVWLVVRGRFRQHRCGPQREGGKSLRAGLVVCGDFDVRYSCGGSEVAIGALLRAQRA